MSCCGTQAVAPKMDPIALARLGPLMRATAGSPDIVVGIVDGPIRADHPYLAGRALRVLSDANRGAGGATQTLAALHGTFVAGILAADRGSPAPAICPGCRFVSYAIFGESRGPGGHDLVATPQQLGDAISSVIDAGARIVNLSVALAEPSSQIHRNLDEVFTYAASRGTILVTAAGNQGTLGTSALTRHAWAIPVAAVDATGAPTPQSNLGRAIGRHGLAAPGMGVTSLGLGREPMTLGGTSAAAPFVSGTAALLWSLFPQAPAAAIVEALRNGTTRSRSTVTPPLLDAMAAHDRLARGSANGRAA
jgi:subtilisin family serine protease